MEKIILKSQIREETGKEAVKKIRHEGSIPAVVYKGKKSLNIKISAKDFFQVIHTKAGENVIVNLKIGISQHWIVIPGNYLKSRASLCNWLNKEYI